MLNFILRRLIMLIPVLLGVSIVVFMMLHLSPGDPARQVAGATATPDQVENVRQTLGLDRPLAEQYTSYLGRLLRGDMGRSLRTNRPVTAEIMPRYVATLQLTGAALVIAITTGLSIGVISATRQYSVVDNVLSALSLIGLSIPVFWLGLMLILLFSVRFGVLPAAGSDTPVHFVLPAITLGAFAMATIARMTRGSMLDVLHQEYIQAARAKGLREYVVIVRHALKNAMIPILTVIGLQTGQLLGGAVLTETVFAWPGIGRLMVEAIQGRDFPVVQGAVLLTAVTFVVINLLVDLLYAFVDPRIRYS
jgi:peptide/nickel transport system permease protein